MVAVTSHRKTRAVLAHDKYMYDDIPVFNRDVEDIAIANVLTEQLRTNTYQEDYELPLPSERKETHQDKNLHWIKQREVNKKTSHEEEKRRLALAREQKARATEREKLRTERLQAQRLKYTDYIVTNYNQYIAGRCLPLSIIRAWQFAELVLDEEIPYIEVESVSGAGMTIVRSLVMLQGTT